jgi:nucleoid DNA-binding protein
MTYEDLIVRVADQSGLNSEVVRRALFHLPDVLLQLGVGDDVRTPLGVFRMTQSQSRNVMLPDGKTEALVPAKTVVKLKPGSRLRKD